MGITAKKIDLSTLLCKDLKPYKDGKICTQAFNYAFQNYSEIYISAGVYYIDNSLIVKSNTEIVADKNAEIVLIKGVKTLLLRNESVVDGSYKSAASAPTDENIYIEGGVWAEENTERLGYGLSGCFDEDNTLKGVSTCFLFSGVKGLTLKNITFRNTAGFACR